MLEEQHSGSQINGYSIDLDPSELESTFDELGYN